MACLYVEGGLVLNLVNFTWHLKSKMGNLIKYYFQSQYFILVMVLIGCRDTELAPPVEVLPNILSPTLVSVNAISTQQADLLVKAGFMFSPADWSLTMTDASNRPVSLKADATQRLDLFNLILYQATDLTPGQTYQLRMRTRNAGGDSVRIERPYIHRATGPRWLRLAHAPIDQGDFAGSALSTDNAPTRADANFVSVWQLTNDNTWQTFTYGIQQNQWFNFKDLAYRARHRTVRYNLQAVKGVVYEFAGLGYTDSELLPGRRFYAKDMAGGGLVVPFYAGPDGETRWFTTLDRAYHLTDGSQEVWVRRGSWEQYRTADLPELAGTLATFRLGTTGYVVNQRLGQPTHVWAFDTKTEQWSRRADFPGLARSLGVGFQVDSDGYFGLGVNANEETLRDVWQYNPVTDRWQYVTDYPGQGSTYPAVAHMQGRVFLGWGYEHQPTGAGGVRLIGCTDWWEFKP